MQASYTREGSLFLHFFSHILFLLPSSPTFELFHLACPSDRQVRSVVRVWLLLSECSSIFFLSFVLCPALISSFFHVGSFVRVNQKEKKMLARKDLRLGPIFSLLLLFATAICGSEDFSFASLN